MKVQFKSFLFFLFFLVPLLSFSQSKKVMYFDQNWQQSISRYTQFYSCECYVLPTGAYDGPFTCYTVESDVKVKAYYFTNNILDGKIYEYFENGDSKLEAHYKKGLPINEWKEWSEEGELVVHKTFDENNRIIRDKNKQTEYEKMYFNTKPYEAPVFGSQCILMSINKQKYYCSDSLMLEHYKHPPLPPSYFTDTKFQSKKIIVKLKYKLSDKGKVEDVKIVESSGDAFLDELAGIHVLNMLPFESAIEYGNPIKVWIDADIEFNF